MQQPRTTSGLAVASLVLGILWLGGLGAVLALVFGFVALSQIKSQPERYQGRGMAIAGVVLGALGIIVPIIAVVALVLVGDGLDERHNSSPPAAAETTIQQQTITAPPPVTEIPQPSPTTVSEPMWSVADITQQLGLTAVPEDGMTACGSITVPAGQYIPNDSPFFTVGVFDSSSAASDYLDAIEQAITGAASGPVACVDASGVAAVTFVDPSTATRVNADTLDEQVTVEFSPGNSTVITQTEARCGNVVVSGTPADITSALSRLGC